MAIVLPKDKRFLIGFRFPELIPFEMNTVPLTTILPPVFRLAILEGRDSSRVQSADIASIPRSTRALASHARLQGFDSPTGLRLLERIVQSSLIRATRSLRSKELQIDGLFPFTVAPYKVGFPSNQAGFRQVDRLLYDMLVDQWEGEKRRVSEFIVRIFGDGVEVKGVPTPSAKRLPGEQRNLDVLSELSLAYVDAFEAITPKSGNKVYSAAKPLPNFQEGFGRDLYRFLWSYSDRVPRLLLVDQIVTLVALELMVMTLKLLACLPTFWSDPNQLPGAMTSQGTASPPEIFVDFTANPRHLSRSMAVGCVRRDIAQVEPFMRAVFSLRYLKTVMDILEQDPDFRKEIRSQLGDFVGDSPEMLMRLVELARQPQISSEIRREARSHRHAILEFNRESTGGDEDDPVIESDADRLVQNLEKQEATVVQQVHGLLYEAQSGKSKDNILGWIRSVGGVGTTYGLISGAANRRTWAYAPTNDLLMVLVQLCAVDYPGWNPAKGAQPESFGLAEFLEWLEHRFGIIVDRPPADLGFDGPEHAAAARENLQALLRRLRQMGMFEDQSDDFSVQQITPPFMDVDPASARDTELIAR
jgi:hypothetical protein